MASDPLPLAGIRVLDLVEGPMQTVGRLLADLGAEVIRVEPPEGSPDRTSGVVADGTSLTFAVRNANTSSLAIDPDRWREEADALLAAADVVIASPTATSAAAGLLDADESLRRHPGLVAVVVSDFGLTGPMRDRLATPAVHLALSSVLSRSGLPEVPRPLLPPEFLAYEAAAAQAVWTVLLAYSAAVRSGSGDHVDLSVSEALVQVLDPGYGIGGSARAGDPTRNVSRGRPDARHLYPIFPAADGWVRICILSVRQWRGMFEWLGRPEAFADPAFDRIGARFGAAATLYPMIGAMLAGLTREEATAKGQALGVPVAGLADASEVLATEAFQQAGSFTELPLPDGRTATAPLGWFELDGERIGIREPAPAVGGADAGARPRARFGEPDGAAPFAGIRVLDLGVIVVGAELGRLLADYGADVLKVESSAFPDGSRQSWDGSEMTGSFAWGHRNKRSVGVDLKSAEGKRVFRDLVAGADVVLTNFKPGTLASLGFGWDELVAINPRIVLSESSAFGNRGPWSSRLGYGPLVRASSGLSALWRYPEVEGSFSDAITIFPDHVVARLNAAAVAALLLRRRRTGRGGRVSTAQIDTIFGAMADLLALESLYPGSIAVRSAPTGDAPRGVFPAAGDDEWVVVDGQGDERFRRLAGAVGHPEWLTDPDLATADRRLAAADRLDAELAAWTSAYAPRDAADLLQAAGVPAGAMVRVEDLLVDPHLIARGAFGRLDQPQLPEPVPTNLGEARSARLPAPALGPAPLLAEHTREVVRDDLGRSDEEIDALLASGALEAHRSRAAATTA